MPRIQRRLHAIFTIIANQREFLFCYTRFRYVIFFVQTTPKNKFTFLGENLHFSVNLQWQSIVTKLEFCKNGKLCSR